MLTGPVPFLPVEPSPPTLVVTRTEEVLSINATYELPHCMPPPDLKYEVDFWKEGIKNKVKSPFPAPQAGPPSPTAPPNPSASHPACLLFAHLLQEALPTYLSLLAVTPDSVVRL